MKTNEAEHSKLLKAYVIAYSDSAFSDPHQIVSHAPPKFDPDAFTFVGKEMDGLESRRHRAFSLDGAAKSITFDPEAHNSIRLGLAKKSRLNKIVISTKWFTGNQVPRVSLELIDSATGKTTGEIPSVALAPDSETEIPIDGVQADECLIRCFYDGGISRVHFYGAPLADQPLRMNLLKDADVLYVSNEHYGKPGQALTGSRAENHMLGWESARTGLGESVLFELKDPGTPSELEVDTYRHVFNSPLCCALYGGTFPKGTGASEIMSHAPKWEAIFKNGASVRPENLKDWAARAEYRQNPNYLGLPITFRLCSESTSRLKPILEFGALKPDTLNKFNRLVSSGAHTHLLFQHFPNGGIHALRVFGK